MLSLQLQLDWQPNAQFAGILLALHRDWYRGAGIDLNILPWQPYTNPVDRLNQDCPVVVSTEDNLLILARAAGQPVQAIAAMMQHSGIGWMALSSSGIRQISDLKGKRIGIHGDGETALQVSLAQVGLAAADVEIVEVGYNYAELLQSGEFDAIQCLVMVEPLELARQGLELVAMPAYTWGYSVYSQVLATSDRLLATQPRILQQFLRITFDGWRAAFTDPAAAAEIVANHFLPDSTSSLQQELLVAMQPLFEGQVGLDRLGWMEPYRWTQSIDYLTNSQLLDTDLLPEEVMTNALMASVCAPAIQPV
jgi:ABC-type nitrate/sulfonate/bicarbonate transport system substrate-binding protein